MTEDTKILTGRKGNNKSLELVEPLLAQVNEISNLYNKKWLNKVIPHWSFLPSAGKEISIAPIFNQAVEYAYILSDSDYFPCSEVAIKRKGTSSGKGHLDLALVSRKKLIAIEMKYRRMTIKGQSNSIISKAIGAIDNQLKSIEFLGDFDRKVENVGILILSIRYPNDCLDNDDVIKKINKIILFLKEDNNGKNLTKDYSYHFQAWDKPHRVNSRSTSYSYGTLLIAFRPG